MFEIESAIFAAIVFVFALVSRRVERLNVTAPMAFIAAGMLFGASHVTSSALNTDVLLLVGSIALALVLFTDASRINISLFRVNVNLPARLLVVGLPLTIAAGAVIAALLFTNLTIWQAAIIGAVLAPTDAGLGQAIVTSERVPVRIREALNVESGLNATMQNAITQGYQDGIAQVNAAAAHWPGVPVVNGWVMPYSAGAYGTNYTLRAGMALASPLYNLPQDALYLQSFINATGVPYSGAYNYLLHFANNSTPPVNAFWSITLYDSQGFFVPNPVNRYVISPHLGNLTYNPDGSLDICIQNASPGANKESNWLPAPSGGFQFVLRQYWPQESALNGSWVPPAIQTVGPASTTTNATSSAA
jgi:hypothetical protein